MKKHNLWYKSITKIINICWEIASTLPNFELVLVDYVPIYSK